MKNKTQKQIVLEKLQKDGEVSNIWAVNNYILRLSERVREIIKDGFNIETYYEINKVTGKRSRSASYKLIRNT